MLDKSTYSLKVDSPLLICAGTCLCLLLEVTLPTPVIPYCTYSTNIKLLELRKELVLGVLIIYNYYKFVRIVRKSTGDD